MLVIVVIVVIMVIIVLIVIIVMVALGGGGPQRGRSLAAQDAGLWGFKEFHGTRRRLSKLQTPQSHCNNSDNGNHNNNGNNSHNRNSSELPHSHCRSSRDRHCWLWPCSPP